jgi:exodeoxyribonuclease V alpha subunit
MSGFDPGVSRFDFRKRLPESQLDPDWRAIDRAVARWVLAHGGSLLLARIAAWASHAEGRGDSVLELGEHGGLLRAPLDDEALAALAAEPLVASLARGEIAAISVSDEGSQDLRPFVLEGSGFYLRRNHAHEQAVAVALRARRESICASNTADSASAGSHTAAPFNPRRSDLDPTPAALAALQLVREAWTNALFAEDTRPQVEAQRAAVADFADRRLFVLTGGPGTGKTTTVLRMLLLRVRAAIEAGAAPPRLHLAAPTGKAAARLAQALKAGIEALTQGPQALGPEWSPALDPLRSAQAGTLHRLLGSRGPGRGPVHHAGRPLPLDLLVIDEASMVDLTLLRHVLDALPERAALLLVGDAEQLASVGTGSVLRDLVEALAADPRGDLVRLSHSFRAERALQPLNAALQDGDFEGLQSAARSAGAAFRRIETQRPEQLARALREHARGLLQDLDAAGVFKPLPGDPLEADAAVVRALDALKRRQLLCALREGEYGALAADATLAALLKSALGHAPQQQWFAGRALMIQQNDYAAGLFNGDVGLCLQDADGALRVWFEPAAEAGGIDATQPPRPRAFSPASLPAHAGAFALSVHKSQGSEYDHVALLLPPDPEHPILSRPLLYTGATRARSSLELWVSEAVLSAALARPAQRASGLRARLLAAGDDDDGEPQPGVE